jgi:lycopene cyclase domain-containing protein
MIFTVSAPILRGFEPKIAYYKKWKAFFPAALIVAIPFWIWDFYFTEWGFWGFNPKYLTNIYILNLPLEEVLFFLVVPFTCIFCYEVFNYFIKNDIFEGVALQITWVLGIFLTLVGLLHLQKSYTLWACGGAGLLLCAVAISKPKLLGRFWFMWLIIIVPKLLVNGTLTGSFTPEPIVWYNNEENLGIRVSTIPVEDFAYNTLMLLGNWVLYEFFKTKMKISSSMRD